MNYIVTNIRVEDSMLQEIKRRAVERRVPASVIIREAIREYLASSESSKVDWEREKAELMKFCGIGRSEGGKRISRGSTDVDEFLYGPNLFRKKKNK